MQVDAKILYLCNPDNPSGTWHSADAIAAAIARLPPGCTLLLDEAYHELGHELDAPPPATAHPRLIRFRTFSKGYGMAGLRIGYAIGAPETISAYDKVRSGAAHGAPS